VICDFRFVHVHSCLFPFGKLRAGRVNSWLSSNRVRPCSRPIYPGSFGSFQEFLILRGLEIVLF